MGILNLELQITQWRWHMRVHKISLIIMGLLFFLINFALAAEPQLILEEPVEGKRVMGNMAGGDLLLVSSGGISTLTPEGKESTQPALEPNQGLVASGDGEFYGITTFSENVPSGFLGAEKFELFSADGAKLWELNRPPVADFYVSNRAFWIVGIASGGDGPESFMIFYDHAGDSVFSIKVGFLQGISFSQNGECVLINSAKTGLSEFCPAKDSGANTLTKTDFGPADNFSVSANGEYVAVFSNGKLDFFYQGKSIVSFSKENMIARKMCFSPEGNYLGVIDKKTLYLFQTNTGKLKWQYFLEKPELSFVSLDISGLAKEIVVGVDFDKGGNAPSGERHTKGFVYLLDAAGKSVWTKELSYRLWGINYPKVQFSPDGTKFYLLTREKAYLYQGY
jgi:outer membrane protein assembly factor BamB